MDLQSLLGEIPLTSFVDEYFHRLPFSLPGAAEPICGLAGWDVLAEILPQDDVDLMIVRDGRQLAGRDPRTVEAARALSDDGFTLLVRHAERHHPPLQQLADSFARDFQGPVNVHIYATPPGRHGFSWHYDAEDVFIFQTGGRKEYSLRKNTVHPWPLVESMTDDLQYPREIMPLMRVVLGAGDWLYIPCGYWHKAETPPGDATAFSVALGVMSPSALDVFDALRTKLLDSILWRQRLPVDGAAAVLSCDERQAHYRDLLRHLADDLSRQLVDQHFLQEFLERRKHRADSRKPS